MRWDACKLTKSWFMSAFDLNSKDQFWLLNPFFLNINKKKNKKQNYYLS